MAIFQDVDVFSYRLPFTAPTRIGTQREGLLLRIKRGTKEEGWGEIAPLPGHSIETFQEAREQVLSLRESLCTAHFSTPDGITAWLDRKNVSSSVRFGIELAYWNLLACQRKVSLCRLMVKAPRATVSVSGLLMGSTETVLAHAAKLRDAGYISVKLKVGQKDIDDDVTLVRALRGLLGRDVGLRLDANRAWSLGEALAFVHGISGVDIDYVEEPLRNSQELPELAARCSIPIALDETMATVNDLATHTYVRAIVLKPTLLGGLSRTLQFAAYAKAWNVQPVISSSFETGVGLLGIVALGAACGPGSMGIDTYCYLALDVLRSRPDLSKPFLCASQLHATSYSVDEKMLMRQS